MDRPLSPIDAPFPLPQPELSGHWQRLPGEPAAVAEASGLFAVDAGRWELTIGDERQLEFLQPGDVILVTANVLSQWRCLGHGDVAAGSPGDEIPVQGQISFLEFSSSTRFPEEAPLAVRLPGLDSPQPRGSRLDVKESRSPQTNLVWVLQAFVRVLLRSVAPPEPNRNDPHLDADVSQILWTMHKFPEKPWTLERLAAEVSLSRSVLAQKFKEQTGTTPMQSLTEIRMKIATDLLKHRRQSLKEVARQAGYRSVSAFSTAYKRWAGRSPSELRE
ncbi:helix-turn-helix transcriptional regulator [Planctomicrobium sp. SH664]|uniref:helix-turn-helix transcriptional regulator n=1 Tax=Planctomicrobium sp. SH664 TaxID=3448125 RepID=UPI003F5C986B